MELAFQAGSAIAIVFPILLLLGIPISVTIGIASIFGILTTFIMGCSCINWSTKNIYGNW